MKSEQVQAILFDLGDTLIHGNFTAGATYSVWQDVYRQLINPTGSANLATLDQLYDAIQQHVQPAMARTWREKTEREVEFLPLMQTAFRAAGLPQAEDLDFLRKVAALEHQLLYASIVEVAPDALSILGELKQRGYKLALVSNFCNVPEVVYANLQQVGLLEWFDVVIVSCEFGWRKPSPRIYQAACERLQIAPAEGLFVGDRLVEDIQGPQQFGLQAIQTVQFHQEPPRDDIIPDGIITHLSELLEQYLK